jgi:hypothetical protein
LPGCMDGVAAIDVVVPFVEVEDEGVLLEMDAVGGMVVVIDWVVVLLG